jgi:CxxC-x17-CxxC domain-containing protein
LPAIDFLEGRAYNASNLAPFTPRQVGQPGDRPMPASDRQLICRQCGSSFTFTAGEQSFYATRGLTNDPSRCPSCRSVRRGNAASTLTDAYVHYGPFASFGGRTPRQMHPAVCTACGQMTEVPFQPRDDRPVLCSECFARTRTADERSTRPQPRN